MGKLLLIICFLLSLVSTSNAQSHTWNNEYKTYAKQIEDSLGLPHGTCQAFALQESGYDSTATRVETGYFNVGSRYYNNIKKFAQEFITQHPDYDITVNLEREQESVSVGLFQLMGSNFRALGYDSEIINPSVEQQFYYFAKFIGPTWKKYHNLQKIASWWNTGSVNRSGRRYDLDIVKYQRKFSY